MDNAVQWLVELPWGFVIIACLTLGLAPFSPPHIVEKIGMLMAGDLKKPIDIFDMFFHGIPWILGGMKLALRA